MSSSPLRILYVLNSADIYGASRCLVRLCQTLDRTRFTPVVLLPESGPLIPLLEKAKVELIRDPNVSVITRRVFKSWRLIPFFLWIPFAAWRVRSLIRRHRIDLVHTNVGTILSSALGARLARVPHVWHIRDWYGEFGAIWKYYRRYILACSDAVLCVSNAIAGQFPAEPKVTVVHDGFPMEEFEVDHAKLRSEFRQKYQIDQEHFVAGCVGRIKFVRKGQEFLVRAAAILRQQGVDVTVLLVGSPSPGSEDHLPRLHSLIEQIGMSDRVVFTGEIADARPAYAALDVFVLPSAQAEPFGGVVMEAMGMSKPVIATALGGSLDQVVEGETGFLVPPANADAIAAKIRTLLDDPKLRIRMGLAGKNRIQAHFSLQQTTERIEEIYSGLRAK